MILIKQENLVFLNIEIYDSSYEFKPHSHYKIYMDIKRNFIEELLGNLYEDIIIETENGYEKYEPFKIIYNYWQDEKRKEVYVMSLRAYFLELINDKDDLAKEMI